MLQQTQVVTVIPYFDRFIEAFPSIERLAAAPLQDVYKIWEGLGYYSRAKNFHQAAKKVVESHGSKIPGDYQVLKTLPGLGPYCAAAIASIAFGQPVPVVDGNVLRVMTRFWDIDKDIRKESTKKEIFNRLDPIIQQLSPSEFNQGLMELGALICKPRDPECGICPIQNDCLASKLKKTHLLPVKSKRPPVPHHVIGVAIVEKNREVLIARRRPTQMLGGLWEFPGGKKNV